MYIRYSFSLEIMGSCARWEIKSAVHLLTATTRGWEWGWGRESERGWGRGRESERGERAVELSKKKEKRLWIVLRYKWLYPFFEFTLSSLSTETVTPDWVMFCRSVHSKEALILTPDTKYCMIQFAKTRRVYACHFPFGLKIRWGPRQLPSRVPRAPNLTLIFHDLLYITPASRIRTGHEKAEKAMSAALSTFLPHLRDILPPPKPLSLLLLE